MNRTTPGVPRPDRAVHVAEKLDAVASRPPGAGRADGLRRQHPGRPLRDLPRRGRGHRADGRASTRSVHPPARSPSALPRSRSAAASSVASDPAPPAPDPSPLPRKETHHAPLTLLRHQRSRANQTVLDVTGNNIANANTVGFKASNAASSRTPSARCSPRRVPPPGQRRHQPDPGRPRRPVGGITTNFNQGSPSHRPRHRPDDLRRRLLRGQPRRRGHVHPRGRVQLRQRAGNLVTVDGDIVQGYAAAADGTVSDRRPGRHRHPGHGQRGGDQPDALLQHRRRRRSPASTPTAPRAAVPARPGQLRQPRGPREGRRHVVPGGHELRHGADRRRGTGRRGDLSAARWRCRTSTSPRSSPT